MSDESKPDTSDPYDDALRRMLSQQAECEKVACESLAAICDQLTGRGIKTVRIEYDGCGDSGTVENVTAYTGKKKIKLGLKLRETLLDASYDLLPGGWEINDGSYGELVIDVAERRVTREHNWRSCEHEEDTFAL